MKMLLIGILHTDYGLLRNFHYLWPLLKGMHLIHNNYYYDGFDNYLYDGFSELNGLYASMFYSTRANHSHIAVYRYINIFMDPPMESRP